MALSLLVLSPPVLAQGLAERLWTDVAEPAAGAGLAVLGGARQQAAGGAFRTVQLDQALMAEVLAEAPLETTPLDARSGIVLPLPTPDGGFAAFRVVEAPVMAPELQARYPQLRSYLGRGVDTPGTTVRISSTPDGFRALVLGTGGTLLVDPLQRGEAGRYSVYHKRDYVPDLARVQEAYGREQVLDELGDVVPPGAGQRGAGTGVALRTYRLALAATGEYTAFHGGTVEGGLAAQVAALTRVNGIYERDLAVRLELVSTNDQLVYTDPDTDPYSNNNPGALLSQNQSTLDAVIGSANYDVGHVFSTGGGGLASLGVVCVDGLKARGETGLAQPINDVFYVDYVAHEIGHQFRANHTFNGSVGSCYGSNRNAATAYEPGSGSTIMAYAGICGSHDLQSNSDDYFHTASLGEISTFVTSGSGSTCGSVTETGNLAPEVTAEGDGLSIPIGTPFVLAGRAEDDAPDELTYTWEEVDLGSASAPPGVVGWNEGAPFFRSFGPVETPVRYFPDLRRLLDGLTPVPGEGLPVDGRTLRFRVTARDNAGGVGDAEVQVHVVEEAGPFVVTFATEEGLRYQAGSGQEVTWDVAGTDAGSVDAPLVDILLSDDGGETFAFVLAEGTPNDGSETVWLPDVATEAARIMIRGSGHLFFDVNDQPFALAPAAVANEAQPEATHSLSAVYPNPLGVTSSRATLNLTVDQSQTVRVAVYDALGRHVAVPYDGPLAAGQNRQITLDAAGLAGGSYFVRVVGETFTDVRQVTVVR